jgi:hypothetical protein
MDHFTGQGATWAAGKGQKQSKREEFMTDFLNCMGTRKMQIKK